jgi:hypothetical protein
MAKHWATRQYPKNGPDSGRPAKVRAPVIAQTDYFLFVDNTEESRSDIPRGYFEGERRDEITSRGGGDPVSI